MRLWIGQDATILPGVIIALLQAFKWWDLPIAEINQLIPLLHDGDLEKVKERIREALSKNKRLPEKDSSCRHLSSLTRLFPL
jgi:hypothetical protein